MINAKELLTCAKVLSRINSDLEELVERDTELIRKLKYTTEDCKEQVINELIQIAGEIAVLEKQLEIVNL